MNNVIPLPLCECKGVTPLEMCPLHTRGLAAWIISVDESDRKVSPNFIPFEVRELIRWKTKPTDESGV